MAHSAVTGAIAARKRQRHGGQDVGSRAMEKVIACLRKIPRTTAHFGFQSLHGPAGGRRSGRAAAAGNSLAVTPTQFGRAVT